MKNASFVGIVVGSVLALAALPAFAGGGGQDTNQQEPASDVNQQVQSNGNYNPPQTGEADYGSNPNQQQGNIPQSNNYNGSYQGADPNIYGKSPDTERGRH
jgi:hypothetical protein